MASKTHPSARSRHPPASSLPDSPQVSRDPPSPPWRTTPSRWSPSESWPRKRILQPGLGIHQRAACLTARKFLVIHHRRLGEQLHRGGHRLNHGLENASFSQVSASTSEQLA